MAISMTMGSRMTAVAGAIGAMAVLSVSGAVSAQDFYDGKRITIVTGGTPGAGLDAYVRLVARYYTRHIPGQPAIVVQNMPGAGSYTAAEYVETQAARDGTVLGSVFPGAIMAPLLDAQKPRFDPTRFVYIGTAETGPRVCVSWHTSKVATYEDMLKSKLIVAASQSGGSSRDYALMANALAKTQMQLVSGYKGGADMFLALERGEVEGLCAFDWSTIKAARANWLSEKRLNLLVQFGVEPDKELTALGLPDFKKHVAPADHPVADLVVAQQIFSRMFFVPGAVPADRVKVLREAFMRTMTDPAFRSDAEKQQMNVDPLDGARVQEIVARIYASPADVVERARKALVAP
jgi:tripartite-type tricarboxylate transporter receptor subunit TctC